MDKDQNRMDSRKCTSGMGKPKRKSRDEIVDEARKTHTAQDRVTWMNLWGKPATSGTNG